MNWVVLTTALLLAVLWVISLSVGAAAAWFNWLVFIAAVVLFVTALSGMGSLRRRPGQPG